MRIWCIIVLAIIIPALTGCAASAPAVGEGVPGLAVVARSLAGGDYVEVEVRHRSLDHRVEQIALVAPDGARFPSRDMRTRQIRERYHPGTSVGFGAGSGGGFGVGLGFLFPLDSLFRNPRFRTRALVRVPDKASYRAENTNWKISILMGNRHGKPRTILRPAPPPR